MGSRLDNPYYFRLLGAYLPVYSGHCQSPRLLLERMAFMSLLRGILLFLSLGGWAFYLEAQSPMGPSDGIEFPDAKTSAFQSFNNTLDTFLSVADLKDAGRRSEGLRQVSLTLAQFYYHRVLRDEFRPLREREEFANLLADTLINRLMKAKNLDLELFQELLRAFKKIHAEVRELSEYHSKYFWASVLWGFLGVSALELGGRSSLKGGQWVWKRLRKPSQVDGSAESEARAVRPAHAVAEERPIWQNLPGVCRGILSGLVTGGKAFGRYAVTRGAVSLVISLPGYYGVPGGYVWSGLRRYEPRYYSDREVDRLIAWLELEVAKRSPTSNSSKENPK